MLFSSGTTIPPNRFFPFLFSDSIYLDKADWLIPIEKAYPELKAEYDRLELNKTLTKQRKNEAFASLLLDWGQVVNQVWNLYLTKQYLIRSIKYILQIMHHK